MIKKIKHKKVKKPENKIKEYEKELIDLQDEINDLTMKKIEIRITINKLELNLESL